MTDKPSEWIMSFNDMFRVFTLPKRVVTAIMGQSRALPFRGRGNYRGYTRRALLGLHVACQLYDRLGLTAKVTAPIFDWFVAFADDEAIFSTPLNTFMLSGGRYIAVRRQGEQTDWHDLQSNRLVPYTYAVGEMPMVTSVLYYQIKAILAAMESNPCPKPPSTRQLYGTANVIVRTPTP